MKQTISGPSNVLMSILVILLTLILGIYVWAAVSGRGTNHEQLADRMDRVEKFITEINCVAFIPIEDRTPLRLSECRLPEGSS
jgi:hypothetical protein